jgi:ABC-type transporter Mla subunit MlaD
MQQTAGLARRGQDKIQQKGQLDRMAGRQEAMAQGADKTAQRLRDLSQKTPAAAPELAARMDAAAEAMRDAGRKVQGGEGMAAQMAQRNALAELNQLAADMARLQQAMSKGSAGGDIADLLKQLEQMAEQQRQLNAQAQQSGDGSPMLGQLGDEQAMLGEAMQKLMQGDGGGQLADKLGGVGQDMDDTARDLHQQHLGAETKTRQRDILRKMLDAQQSMYTRERESRERVAERPKAYKAAASPPAVHSSEAPKLKLPKAEETATFGVPDEYRDAAAAYERRVGGGK